MIRNYRFWLVIAVALTLLILACLGLFAAQDRAIASPDRLDSIAGRLIIDLNGTVISFPLTAKFVSIDARPSGEVTTTQIGSVEVDLMKSNGQVVVDGVLVDDREAADQVIAIMTREWRKAHPSALPQRRRALRAP